MQLPGADAGLNAGVDGPGHEHLCWRQAQQLFCFLNRPSQPLVDITRLDGDHAALVLVVGANFEIGFVHAAHQLMMVGVQREHRVALVHLTCGLVGPGVPQARQTPRCPIGPAELPPDVLARLPVRLVERRGGDDATPTAFPQILVARLLGQLFATCVVRQEFELYLFGEPGDQRPPADNQLSLEVCGVPRTATRTPDASNLFRFSALTHNGHLIHYDRDCAVHEEFYPASWCKDRCRPH